MSNFHKNVSKFGKDAQQKAERFRRAVILKFFSSVIMDTPVDTGRLRGNWQTTVGTPALKTLETIDKSGSVAIASVMQNMGDGTGKDLIVYMANNLPYAATAEFGLWHGPSDKVTAEGFSTQAQGGMVRKNYARIKEIIDRAKASGKI